MRPTSALDRSGAKPLGGERLITGRPEEALLLSAARVEVDQATAGQLRELVVGRMDWDFVLRTASLHGVLPLLYRHLQAVCHDVVPRSVLDRLRADSQRSAAQSLLLTAELFRLLARFDYQGIPLLPYKGPTLAACAFGNVGLRRFGDLDFLVRARDLPRARRLLLAEHYRPAFKLTAAQETAYVADLCQLPLLRADGKCLVELHTRLMPRGYLFRMDPDALWPRATTVVVEGRRVPTLAASDLLLVLCVHGAKHLWASLGWICDVAELVRRQMGLDWAALLAEARRLRSERMLLLGLHLAEALLDAPLPDIVRDRVQAVPAVAALIQRVRRRLFAKDPSFTGGWETCRFHFAARERWSDRLRYGLYLGLAPNLADWTFLSLPPWLAALYYAVRPVRLAGKYARRLFGGRGPAG